MNNAKQMKIIYAVVGLAFAAVLAVVLTSVLSAPPPDREPIEVVKPTETKPVETKKPGKKVKIDLNKVFADKEVPKAPPVVKKAAPVKVEPAPVRLKQFTLRLKGVIINEAMANGTCAFLLDTRDKQTYECNVGQHAGDGWKVISIQDEFTIVQKGQQKVRMGVDGSLLDVSEKGAIKEYDVPALTSSDTTTDVASYWFYRSPEEIKKKLAQLRNPVPDNDREKKSPTRFVINRRTLNNLRGNMKTYSRDWVIAPLLSADKKHLEGIKIYGVNRFSFPYSFGARPGDIIKAINGTPINSPLALFRLVGDYNKLVYSPEDFEYKITVERLGKPVLFNFLIKGQ